MRKWISKIWRWLCGHKDLAHLIGGFGFGLVFNDPWAGVIAGITAEVKDKQWGGEPTMKDFLLTVAGGFAGYGLRWLIRQI